MSASFQRSDGCSSSSSFCIPVPESFSLQKAVCSYGFFMMAPNVWTPHCEPMGSCPPAGQDLPTDRTAGANWEGVLERPMRLADGRAAWVRLSGPVPFGAEGAPALRVDVSGVERLPDDDRRAVERQVARMLRLTPADEAAVRGFHHVHPAARAANFGRLFRSPTLFEDMVKSLLLCNCGWGRTLSMCQALCELQAELKGPPLGTARGCPLPPTTTATSAVPPTESARDCPPSPSTPSPPAVPRDHPASPPSSGSSAETPTPEPRGALLSEGSPAPAAPAGAMGAFPAPEELAALDATSLGRRCGLGYRAVRVARLAADVASGALDLTWLERAAVGGPLQPGDGAELRKAILQVPGFGPFTAANVMCCVGEFSLVPSDSETVRHLKQEAGGGHGRLLSGECGEACGGALRALRPLSISGVLVGALGRVREAVWAPLADAPGGLPANHGPQHAQRSGRRSEHSASAGEEEEEGGGAERELPCCATWHHGTRAPSRVPVGARSSSGGRGLRYSGADGACGSGEEEPQAAIVWGSPKGSLVDPSLVVSLDAATGPVPAAHCLEGKVM